MPTQSKANPVTESIDAASERVVELNEKAVANGKKAGAAALDSYEKAVVSVTESYEKAAGATKVDWIVSAATAQADLTRELVKTYTSAAREFVS
jgi:3-methyladenine DNA glycosylase AlkD